MAKRNLPQPFEIDKIRFKDCFTGPSLRHFVVLITGWVLTVGTHTISQVILTMGLHESEHFANVYKFLLRSRWDTDKVAFEIFRMIVETLLPDASEVESIVDDTLNPRVGKKICGAGFQHDGDAPKGGKPIGYGVCFVIIGVALRLPGISDRVFCLPYAARLWWPEKAKIKPDGGTYKSKSQLAAELVELTRRWLGPSMKLRVIVDGGYSNKKLLNGRHKGVHITGKLPRNAARYDLVAPELTEDQGPPKAEGCTDGFSPTLFRHPGIPWEWIWTRLYGKETIVEVFQFDAIWYGAAGNDPLTVVLVRDPCGKYPETAFFDTVDKPLTKRWLRDTHTGGARKSPTGKQRAFWEAPIPSADENDPSPGSVLSPTGPILSWCSGLSASSEWEGFLSSIEPLGISERRPSPSPTCWLRQGAHHFTHQNSARRAQRYANKPVKITLAPAPRANPHSMKGQNYSLYAMF